MKRTILVIVMLGLALGLFSPGARALSCAEARPDQAFTRAEAVFLGQVTRVRETNQVRWQLRPPFITIVPDYMAIAEFSVREVWRGSVHEQMVVAVEGVHWGNPFQPGSTYIVYANAASSGGLVIPLCGRVGDPATGSEDRLYLGPGASPSLTGANRPFDADLEVGPWLLWLGAMSLFALAPLSVWLMRRGRERQTSRALAVSNKPGRSRI